MCACVSYYGSAMEACIASPTSHHRPNSSLKSGVSSFSFTAPASTCLHRAYAWKSAQACISNSSSAGRFGKKNDQEGNVLQDLASLLGNCEQLKAVVDSSSSSGVGPDMRNRVDHLLKRVRILKQSAGRAARAADGRLPSQLIASLRGLEREHSSLENIVRLATQAGPVLIEETGNDLAVVAQKGGLPMNYEAGTVDVELAQGEENGAPVEVLSGPKYVMSAAFSEGSFKLSAVRAEIERRVREQLTKKRVLFDSEQAIPEVRAEFQKVPSVNQRSLEGNKDNAIRRGNGFLPQMVDAHSACNKQETEFQARRGEKESGTSISLELHDQMGRKFDKALSDLKEEFSDVTNDLRKREGTLLTLEEKLMDDQRKLLEKINELSGEVRKRLTEEQLSNTMGKVIFDMEEDLKRIQSQLVSLGSDLNMKDKILAGWYDEQEKIRQEFQAGILRLEGRLHQREDMFEGFNPQGILAELRSVKVTLTALQEGQSREQSKFADWQTKIEDFERSLLSSAQQIKKLTSEVECRVREGEVKDVLNKVLNEVEMQSKKLQEHIECVSAEQVKTASSLRLLQKEWKAHRKELQTQIEDVKDKLIFLETTQNQYLLTELSNIRDKLSELQEQQKNERSLVLEAQQQMVMLEGKGLDLLRRMSENAEVQKQDLLEEVRTLVDELVKNSCLRQRDGMQESVSLLHESNASTKDVGYLSSLALGSESSATVSKNDEHKVTTQEGAQQVHDKGIASLEAFFSVMGHLVRGELKKMNYTSAQTLPLTELHQLGEDLTSNHMDKPNLSATGGENQGQIIILRYDSTWKRAFIHYCADNLGWTEAPGIPMQETRNSEGKYFKEFRIKAARLEFVLTDGQGNWDRAPNGSNYLLEKPGIFNLGSGALKGAPLF